MGCGGHRGGVYGRRGAQGGGGIWAAGGTGGGGIWAAGGTQWTAKDVMLSDAMRMRLLSPIISGYDHPFIHCTLFGLLRKAIYRYFAGVVSLYYYHSMQRSLCSDERIILRVKKLFEI